MNFLITPAIDREEALIIIMALEGYISKINKAFNMEHNAFGEMQMNKDKEQAQRLIDYLRYLIDQKEKAELDQ